MLHAQLGGQLVYHIAKYYRVHVLPEHVEQEPVAHLALLHYQIQVFFAYQPVPEAQEVDAHSRRQYDDRAIYERPGRQETQDYQPEPQEDVDLLVDHVQWQNANGVVTLDLPGDAVLVKRALGHPGEDEDHGVDPVLLVAVHEVDDVDTEREEGAVEETVH